jgi:2-oxoglutarate dehydrogenase E2 component (dihydrolipoamide succinyltransferase)
MSKFDLVMPKMGESVQEATITKWFKNEGDAVEEDDVLLEIATDKVDSEIPSPVDGKISKILFKEGDVVAVGEIIAHIATDDEEAEEVETPEKETLEEEAADKEAQGRVQGTQERKPGDTADYSSSDRFYSPLVKSIAKQEGISLEELHQIEGSGRDGRVKKDDVLKYLESRTQKTGKAREEKTKAEKAGAVSAEMPKAEKASVSVSVGEDDEVIEMDRMRRMIADHMVMSKQTSAHVTSVVEADVTELVTWRNKIKDDFVAREKTKITFMPVFTEAVAKALRDFPRVNASVDGYNIILKRDINIGIAVALPNGNLIVPVVKKADQKNLVGLAHDINAMAKKARDKKLAPDDTQGGTFTITNFGSFDNIIGTPVINQPQVAILAVGAIKKKPSVVETPQGDVIAIRHKMYLSLSYDHRIIDGALGGAFVKRIGEYLEKFDIDRTV